MRNQARPGWEPTVPLEEGLRRTVEYFRHALAD
jgi:nucleoside-diphosphate-sugar epimerase